MHSHRLRLLAILLVLLGTPRSQADVGPYDGRHKVTARSATLTVTHVHDWSSRKVEPLFADLQQHDKFFSAAAKDFGHLEAREAGGRLLFITACPALTHLWISPDSQYIVGLSSVKLYNPYQLVIWQRDGTLLHREHISAQVAKATPDQRRDFAQRFPKAEQFLAQRYFTHAGATYLDYQILGVPNVIGDAAWTALDPLIVPHPYSDDFGETSTNHVFWYDEKDPAPALDTAAKPMSLTLRSPTGKRFTIPLGK